MNRRADRWDHAPMESSFASLKKDSVCGEILAARVEAGAKLFEHIAVSNNRVRRHSSPSYRSPMDYERAG